MLEIAPVGDMHIYTFPHCPQAALPGIRQLLTTSGIDWYMGETGPRFTMNTADTLAAVQEACRLTTALDPNRLIYWYYVGEAATPPNHRDEVYLEIPDPNNRNAIYVHAGHFVEADVGDPRVPFIRDRLRATGWCTRILWRTDRKLYFDIMLTDAGVRDRLAAYKALAAAYPSAQELS